MVRADANLLLGPFRKHQVLQLMQQNREHAGLEMNLREFAAQIAGGQGGERLGFPPAYPLIRQIDLPDRFPEIRGEPPCQPRLGAGRVMVP